MVLQLGDAVYHAGDFRTELLGKDRDFVKGILGDVMQEGSRDGTRVESQVGKNGGNRLRVDDIGFAGLAFLSQVGGVRKLVRPANERRVLG